MMDRIEYHASARRWCGRGTGVQQNMELLGSEPLYRRPKRLVKACEDAYCAERWAMKLIAARRTSGEMSSTTHRHIVWIGRVNAHHSAVGLSRTKKHGGNR